MTRASQSNAVVLYSQRLGFVAELAVFCRQQLRAENPRPVRDVLGIALRQLADHAVSSRGKGKYLGHAPWSRSALRILEGNNGRVRGVERQLSHEHVVPVSYVLDVLLGEDMPIGQSEEVIAKLSVVAVITRTEDQRVSKSGLRTKMPTYWDRADLWARFKDSRVGLYEEMDFGVEHEKT